MKINLKLRKVLFCLLIGGQFSSHCSASSWYNFFKEKITGGNLSEEEARQRKKKVGIIGGVGTILIGGTVVGIIYYFEVFAKKNGGKPSSKVVNHFKKAIQDKKSVDDLLAMIKKEPKLANMQEEFLVILLSKKKYSTEDIKRIIEEGKVDISTQNKQGKTAVMEVFLADEFDKNLFELLLDRTLFDPKLKPSKTFREYLDTQENEKQMTLLDMMLSIPDFYKEDSKNEAYRNKDYNKEAMESYINKADPDAAWYIYNNVNPSATLQNLNMEEVNNNIDIDIEDEQCDPVNFFKDQYEKIEQAIEEVHNKKVKDKLYQVIDQYLTQDVLHFRSIGKLQQWISYLLFNQKVFDENEQLKERLIKEIKRGYEIRKKKVENPGVETLNSADELNTGVDYAYQKYESNIVNILAKDEKKWFVETINSTKNNRKSDILDKIESYQKRAIIFYFDTLKELKKSQKAQEIFIKDYIKFLVKEDLVFKQKKGFTIKELIQEYPYLVSESILPYIGIGDTNKIKEAAKEVVEAKIQDQRGKAGSTSDKNIKKYVEHGFITRDDFEKIVNQERNANENYKSGFLDGILKNFDAWSKGNRSQGETEIDNGDDDSDISL